MTPSLTVLMAPASTASASSFITETPALLKGPDMDFPNLVNFGMKLEFYHIWQLGGYGMVQNDAMGCGNHFHTRPGHSRKFTFGHLFEPLLNLCWTFVGWTNSWPPRPRIGPTNKGQQLSLIHI